MTYKRKASQKRVKRIQKAISLRWRQQEDDNDADETRQNEGDGQLPPPTQLHVSPSPQPSTSSAPVTSISTSSGAATCTPPPSTPDTTPLPATEKTHLQLRQEILQAANIVTASPSLARNTLVTATLDQLDTLVDTMRCPVRSCRNKITVTRSDVGDILQTECKQCHTVVSSASPATYHHRNHDYSVPKIRQVYFSLITGIGYVGLQLNQALVTGGKMNKAAYYTYCRLLYQEMDTFSEERMKEARAAVVKHYTETLHRKPDQDGFLDVDVSFDCTWMKRGYKSHAGVGFAMEVNTGMVIDLDVLFNYCQACISNNKKNTQKKHKCQKNFDGKAGAMEAAIAVRIWSRSSDYKMRFTTFVGDGDSSAYNAVCGLNDGKGPYEVPVIKEECVNHVSKRMGARLRKLKKEEYEVITTKTGKKMKRSLLGGADMLTDDVIYKLSSYYGKAIRDHAHGTVQAMQRAIWATYFHLTSNNKEHYHQCCPKGEDSWCFYNRATALQLPEEAKDHEKKKLYLAKIPKEKLQYIKAVYKDLANPNLLKRCLKGATQNPNESIHAKVWNRCSKAKFCGHARLLFIVKHTGVEHNFGYEGASIISHLLGTDTRLQETMKFLDQERARHATPKLKKKALQKKDDSYQAGEF